MLQILDIKKQYVTGDLVQTALDGVSLTLRDNEFVAILGPSGSGKTTLLNVIGGLDRYDSGDLVINSISTRKYSDRDWDSYRNHTIGFVFQSYNLIPHQSILSNVELALTISGISRSERRKRAKKALEDVGLGNQLHKKPNQMSGGQMQRVAIARALVNNPDILLADEPTGALDSETSVQVMELLKEVSQDRLVVMVTHNPELAEEYANRIVRVRDGKIIDDTNPYSVTQAEEAPPEHRNMGRASMSFLTALSLSFNNLRTKMGRTLLTAFAGSIGIIGIALIMSLSTGFQKYIDKIQEDTLSNYPLTIQTETADMTAALAAFGSALTQADAAEPGTVIEQQMISQMFANIGTNDLASFKAYMDENMAQVENDLNTVKYSYGIKPLIYAEDTSNGVVQVNPGTLFGDMMSNQMMSSYMDTNIFYEMIDNRALLDSQYDVLQGRWPAAEDEMIVVLSSPNQITDYMAYTLGLKDSNILTEMIKKVMNGQEAEDLEEPAQWSYDELMSLTFRLVPAAEKYRYNAEYNVWEDMSDNTEHIKQCISAGTPLKIVGIACPKEGVSTTTLSPGVAYTAELTKKVIAAAESTQIVASQLENPELDVFTGKPFGDASQDSALNFQEMIGVDADLLTSAFGMDVDENAVLSLLENYIKNMAASIDIDTVPAQKDFLNTFSALARDMLNGYIAANAAPETGEAVLRLAEAENLVVSYLAGTWPKEQMQALEAQYQLPEGTLAQVYQPLLLGMITSYIAREMVLPSLPEAQAEQPPVTLTDVTVPDETETTEPVTPSLPEIDISMMYAPISAVQVDAAVDSFLENPLVSGTAGVMAGRMMEAAVQKILMDKLAGFGNVLMNYFGKNFSVDEEKLASAFQFNMSEDDLRRLMEVMSGTQQEATAEANLRNLGYADPAKPTAISLYFVDFASKENFLAFLDGYNADMEAAGLEDNVISYTDVTGIMMSSVRTIIDSVSYVLIAFVAVSLIVSSIMIGIITYISVMERTKEIGILRAIGASKRNISQVFNAETFIIGLCSGLIGIGVTIAANFPINALIHSLTDNPEINAQLPLDSGMLLVLLSMGLTLLGGLIPAMHAAKKDPVIALRSE